MKRKRDPRRQGFTLDEIMIVAAIVCTLLLAVIAVPNQVRPRGGIGERRGSVRNACVANLRQIDNAKRTWAKENGKGSQDTPTRDDLFGFKLYIKKEPQCPLGGTYSLGPVGKDTTCGVANHVLE